MSRKSNIDDIFKDKLGGFQKTPPAGIWENISKELATVNKKKTLIPLLWRYAAGIIIILGIGASWLFFNQEDETPGQLVTRSEEKFTEPALEDEKRSGNDNYAAAEDSLPGKEMENTLPTNNAGTYIAQHAEEIQEGKLSDASDQSPVIKKEVSSAKIPGPTDDSPVIIARITELPEQIEPGKSVTEMPLDDKEIVQKNYTWEDLGISLEDEKPLTNQRKFTLAAVVSPVYSYRDLGKVSSSVNEYFNQSESGKINFAGGLNIGFAASERLSIHSGLMYSRIGIGINDILAVAENWESETDELVNDRNASSPYLVSNSIGSIEPGASSKAKFDNNVSNERSPSQKFSTDLNYVNPEGFYAPADNYIPDDGTIDQYFEYLEVPLLFKYKIIDRKIDFNLLGGVSTNFLVGNRVVYNQDGSSEVIGSTGNIRTFNYSGNFGLGIDYNIAERFHLLFEPQFKYYMNSINSNNLIGNRPYTLGLYSGFIYLF